MVQKMSYNPKCNSWNKIEKYVLIFLFISKLSIKKNIACEKAVRERVVLNNVFIKCKSRCKVMIQVRELNEMLGK